MEAAVPLVGRRMDPFADAVFSRFANKFRDVFGSDSPKFDREFSVTINLKEFIQPIIETVLDMIYTLENDFQVIRDKVINVMDHIKDTLGQKISGNVNLDLTADNIKKTLQNAQMNLSEQFMYNLDSKFPALTASKIPNLNNIMTAVQPGASENREINLTVNLTSLMDGREVAKVTTPYTTEIQEREKERRKQF